MTAEKIGTVAQKLWSRICVSLWLTLKNDDVRVQCLDMDNDSTTIEKVIRETEPSMKKNSHRNHTLKLFTNKLWDLKKITKS